MVFHPKKDHQLKHPTCVACQAHLFQSFHGTLVLRVSGANCWGYLLGCPLFLNDIWSPDFVPALRRFLNVAIKSSMIFPEHLVCCYKSGFNVNLQNTQHHDWFGDVSSREWKIKMLKATNVKCSSFLSPWNVQGMSMQCRPSCPTATFWASHSHPAGDRKSEVFETINEVWFYIPRPGGPSQKFICEIF